MADQDTKKTLRKRKTLIFSLAGVLLVGCVIFGLGFWTFSECGPLTSGRIKDVEKDQAYELTPPKAKLVSEVKKNCTTSTGFVSTSYAGVKRAYEDPGSIQTVKSFYERELPKLGWRQERKSSGEFDVNDVYKKDLENGKQLILSVGRTSEMKQNFYTENIHVQGN